MRKLFASLRSHATALLRSAQMNAEIEEELRSHIAHRTDDIRRSGVPKPEAERRARVEFGGYQRVREECREAAGAPFLESGLQDLRFAFRSLRKSPGFTALAVLTMTLSIGANAVVFGVLRVVLRPLAIPDAERFFSIEARHRDNHSYPDYLDLRDRNRSFSDLIASDFNQAGLDASGEASRTWVMVVSGNYFDALHVEPYLGRLFHGTDEKGPNSAPYIVLSYAYWHTHCQDDPGVVGRKVRLNKHPYTILGVAPPGFRGTVLFANPDLFAPMVNQEEIEGWSGLEDRGSRWLSIVGHLKGGVSPAQATSDLNGIGAFLDATYPRDDRDSTFLLSRPTLAGDSFGTAVRAFLGGLTLLSGLILLAACANLGSLYAARANDRSREVALRIALGGGRLRILRQFFAETLLVSLIGGALGLLSSVALLRALTNWRPIPSFPVAFPFDADPPAYATALLLALGSGLLLALVPMREVLRTDTYPVLKVSPQSAPGRSTALRDLLLGLQVAVCAVLVTSGFVALRGLERSLKSRFGFEPGNVVLADTDLNMGGYSEEQGASAQRRMLQAIEAIPGVEAAGLVGNLPLLFTDRRAVFKEDTADRGSSRSAAEPFVFFVSPDYFRAARTAILWGRNVTWHDDKGVRRVAVVNLEFARRVFGSRTVPEGANFKMRDGERVEVVGLVEDGKYQFLTEDPEPAVFLPILQWPSSHQMTLVVRSGRDPTGLAAEIRSTLKKVDPGLPFYIQTWHKALDVALFPSHIATWSLGILGLMGAMLSVTGVFGMAAYTVSRRLRELGIRVALGASRRDVLRAALGRAIRILALGSAVGLVLGILASRVLGAIVYAATPRDPAVLATVVLAMASLGLLATWIPARRALSFDPAILLREQ